MTDYIIDGAILTDIADAIREQTGSAELIEPGEMSEKIAGLGVREYETWTITYVDGTVEEKKVALL